jgi:hypothetical protein
MTSKYGSCHEPFEMLRVNSVKDLSLNEPLPADVPLSFAGTGINPLDLFTISLLNRLTIYLDLL